MIDTTPSNDESAPAPPAPSPSNKRTISFLTTALQCASKEHIGGVLYQPVGPPIYHAGPSPSPFSISTAAARSAACLPMGSVCIFLLLFTENGPAPECLKQLTIAMNLRWKQYGIQYSQHFLILLPIIPIQLAPHQPPASLRLQLTSIINIP